MTKYLCLLVAVIPLWSCQLAPQDLPVFKQETADLDSLGTRYFEVNRFSGAILVAQQDTLQYHRSFGLADYEKKLPFSKNTAFKIGAVSQYFTAQIIHVLAERQTIQLNQKVAYYLPNLIHDFTIAQVLKHQSGLPTDTLPKLELIEQINSLKLDTGNTGFNTLGYHLLGKLIEEISGVSFEKAIQNYLSDLNLEHTFYKQENSDLAKAYTGFKNYRGQGLERQIAPNYDLAQMFSSKGIKASIFDVWKILQKEKEAYTFGFLPDDGFSYCVSKDAKGQIIIVLSNYRHPVAEEMLTSIKAILDQQPFELPLLRVATTIDPKQLIDYHGVYEINPSFTFEITSDNDRLYVLMFGQKSPLIPQAGDQFFLLDNDASMRFVRETDGKVSGVVLYDGFLDGNLVKKREF